VSPLRAAASSRLRWRLQPDQLRLQRHAQRLHVSGFPERAGGRESESASPECLVLTPGDVDDAHRDGEERERRQLRADGLEREAVLLLEVTGLRRGDRSGCQMAGRVEDRRGEDEGGAYQCLDIATPG
jgi:hypothetical protein